MHICIQWGGQQLYQGPISSPGPSLGAPLISVSPCPSKSRKEMVEGYSVTDCVNIDIVSYRPRAPELNLDCIAADFVISAIIAFAQSISVTSYCDETSELHL